MGHHDLPMTDRRADFFGNVERGARAPLLAGERDEHLMLAVGAANSGEAFLQIAALKKGRHRLFDDRTPIAVLLLKTLLVDLPEGIKVLIEQPPQVGGLGIALELERTGLDTGGDHGRNRVVHMTLGGAAIKTVLI